MGLDSFAAGAMSKEKKKEPQKNRNHTLKRRWIGEGIFISLLAGIILVSIFYETILLRAGKFMAPEEIGTADVIILEGSGTVETGAVEKGMNLLSSGKAARMIVVIHQFPKKKQPFAINEDYPNLIKRELKGLGLKEKQFRVLTTPVHHPITLMEAKSVLETLSREGVKSGILLSNGFHTRRSFLVYRHVGIPLKIKIIPSRYFDEYQLDRWWIYDPAARDFISEFLKLAYYQIRGYIPFKFSY